MKRTEELEQSRLIRWTHLPAVRQAMPALAWLHHSPNGGKRDGFTGAQMKALGTKPGFPDLILPARGHYRPVDTYPHEGTPHGLAIEMKSTAGRVSSEQSKWLAHLSNLGWSVEVARSAKEAQEAICDYFHVDPDSLPPLPEK